MSQLTLQAEKNFWEVTDKSGVLPSLHKHFDSVEVLVHALLVPQKQELLAQRVATAVSQAEPEPHLHTPPVQASERSLLQAGLQTAVNTKHL